MRLKFFTLASSFLAVLFVAYSAVAQENESSKNKVGYIRFWNMLPPANGTFDLRRSGGNPSEANLYTKVPAYRYSSYRELVPGTYNVAVYRTTDANTALKTFTVNLKPNSFFTILVSPEGGAVNVQLFDDTIDPKVASAMLTVRNYFPGLTVDVSSATQSIVSSLPYGKSFVAGNFPFKKIPLTLRTRLPNGTPTESEAEVDFLESKRCTLLIIPDPYGRFRPRVTIDGRNL